LAVINAKSHTQTEWAGSPEQVFFEVGFDHAEKNLLLIRYTASSVKNENANNTEA
jgi:hypothetical protein